MIWSFQGYPILRLVGFMLNKSDLVGNEAAPVVDRCRTGSVTAVLGGRGGLYIQTWSKQEANLKDSVSRKYSYSCNVISLVVRLEDVDIP